MEIGVVGNSHLGQVWSNVLASKGYHVTQLRGSSDNEVYEPGLQELTKCNVGLWRVTYGADYKDLHKCDVVFVALDTPINSSNIIQLDLVEKTINAVIDNLNDTAVLVIMSQVPPGFCRKINFPEERLFHQVDTLVFGQSIERALNPDVIVIGTKDRLVNLFEDSYFYLLGSFDCPKVYVTYEEAEVFKLAMNANLAAQIAVTNTMAELCGHVGATWEAVEQALRLDKRIGTYTKPGLGLGGGHMERDLNTIEMLSNKHGFHSDVIGGALASSHHMRYWALRILEDTVLKYDSDPQIALWGLSYKPGTNSTTDSPALDIVKRLDAHILNVHDPIVTSLPIKSDFGPKFWENPLDCLSNGSPRNPIASCLLIMTPHEEYKKFNETILTVDGILRRTDIDNPMVIIDPYGILCSWKKSLYPYYTLGA